jgi:hypothetical protein
VSLNPAVTILKIVFYALTVAILIIIVYSHLSDMATETGGKNMKGAVEMTKDGKREKSW